MPATSPPVRSTTAVHVSTRTVFTNLLLADEINRTPPRTQAALLEAMEERQISVNGIPRPLPRPVPRRRHPESRRVRGHLPAARGAARPVAAQAHDADPERDAEIDVVTRHAARYRSERSRLAPGRRPPSMTPGVPSNAVTVAPEIAAYVVDLARATRALARCSWGVSPRGSTALLATGRAWAWLSQRLAWLPRDDVRWPAHVAASPAATEAQLEGTSPNSVLDSVLQLVPVPADMVITGGAGVVAVLAILTVLRRSGRRCGLLVLLVSA